MEFLQFLGPLLMIIQLGFQFETQLHVHKTEHRPPSFKKKPHKTINLRYYIFFSYLFMKSLEKSNPRTIGTELPNDRLYQLPKCRGTELLGYSWNMWENLAAELLFFFP